MPLTVRGFVACCVLALVAAPAAGAERLRLARIFGDHMVLQRDAPVPVWGWAAAGNTVTVTFAGQTKTATAGADGRWQLLLDALPASAEQRELTAAAEPAEKVTIADVLVGEVWLAAGQSNMGWPVAKTSTGTATLAKAADPLLRLANVGRQMPEQPATDLSACQWATSTADTAASFSAVGYFFGRDLRRALVVPVGIVQAAWPSSTAQAWTPLEALQANPVLFHYVTEWQKQVADFDAGTSTAGISTGQREKPGDPRQSPTRPAVLYNGLIAPLMPFSFRGVLWYQAEGNNGDPARYETLFPTMIGAWRKGWRDPTLPFLFVQLPAFKGTQPETRAVQARCAADVPHTGMVVTLDVGAADDIHPQNKEPVGMRLALKARGLVYGEKCVHDGPTYATHVSDGDSLIVRFDHADGLHAAGGDVRGFEIAAADGLFRPARGVIAGTTVRLTADGVSQPVAVRYAWASVPDANLFNTVGLPAGPLQAPAGGP
jgi:sialate O-acetylesterase